MIAPQRKKKEKKKMIATQREQSLARQGGVAYKQNNRKKYIFFDLRKIDNRNKWKNYVIVTRVELSVELDVLVILKQPIFPQL